MGHVNDQHVGYGEIALHAVQKDWRALQFVDPDECDDGYLAIAWIAVQKNQEAFDDVKFWDEAYHTRGRQTHGEAW
jgi:hypothetical protein